MLCLGNFRKAALGKKKERRFRKAVLEEKRGDLERHRQGKTEKFQKDSARGKERERIVMQQSVYSAPGQDNFVAYTGVYYVLRLEDN